MSISLCRIICGEDMAIYTIATRNTIRIQIGFFIDAPGVEDIKRLYGGTIFVSNRFLSSRAEP